MAQQFSDISVRIVSDVAQLRSGMQQAQASLSRLEASAASLRGAMGMLQAAIAAVGAGAAWGAMRKAGEWLDEMAKAARRLGISTAGMQQLALAAEYSGVSVEQASIAMGRMLAAVGRGAPAAIEALQRLGISVEDLSTDDMETSILTVLRGLQGIEDPAARAATAVALFGRSGYQLIELATGMDQANEAMQRLGMGFNDAAAGGVERANDAVTTLWASLRELAAGLYADLSPVIEAQAGLWSEVVSWLNRARAGYDETAAAASAAAARLAPSEQPGSGFSDLSRAMEAEAERIEPLRRRAEQIRESLMTPIERATLDALEGWGLWTQGLLDDETMARLDDKLRAAYDEAARAQQEELDRMLDQQRAAEEELQRQWEDMARGRMEALGVPELERELQSLSAARVDIRPQPTLDRTTDPGAARFLGAAAIATAAQQQTAIQQRIAMLLEEILRRRAVAYAG